MNILKNINYLWSNTKVEIQWRWWGVTAIIIYHIDAAIHKCKTILNL